MIRHTKEWEGRKNKETIHVALENVCGEKSHTEYMNNIYETINSLSNEEKSIEHFYIYEKKNHNVV